MADLTWPDIASGCPSTTMTVSSERSQEANLQALAAELHLEIAEHLDEQDIIALRQVCRVLVKNSLDIFAERFFSSRRHALTTHSLQALRDISRTRVFARHVRTVELVAICVGNYGGNLSAPEESAKSWYKEERKRLDICLQPLLLEIFRNLAALESTLSVSLNPELWADETRASYTKTHSVNPQKELRSLWSSSKGTYGMKYLYQKVRPWASKVNIWRDRTEPLMNDINQVMLEFPKLIAELHVASSHHPALDSRRLFADISASQLANMRVSWANLTSLHINLGYRNDTMFAAGSQGCGSGTLLDLAVNLQYLAISASDLEGLDRLRQAVRKMGLSTLHLSPGSCSADSLCQVLQSQRATLRHLKLDNVVLNLEDDSWHEVFGRMSEDLQLETFWARQLETRGMLYASVVRADKGDKEVWIESGANTTVAEVLGDSESWAYEVVARRYDEYDRDSWYNPYGSDDDSEGDDDFGNPYA